MKVLDSRISQLAQRQHGVFTRSQARAAGASPSGCERRLRSGLWERSEHGGVYVLGGQPATWHRRLMACVLAGPVGTVASHRSAAVLCGIRSGTPIEVTVPLLAQHRLRGLVHQLELPAGDRGVIDGIPTTRIERTLLDLAAVVDELQLERALEAALRSGLTTHERLEAYVEAAGGRRWGAGRFRRAVAVSSTGRPTGSELEVMFLQLLRAAGLEEPARQFEVRVDGRRYFLDFAYPHRRLAMELDGRAHHGFDEDRRRQNALVLAGWTVLRFTWADVTERGAQTVAAVAGGLRAA
ncbi:MAG TPA: type IV toxin-antitoxin system AbiEi family antitoxin domain-containing protein [Acidimicrobiales bacterium]